jgi:RecA-family ATPase
MEKEKKEKRGNKLWGIEPGVTAWLDSEAETANDWLVDKLMYKNTICILDGLGASGKSYLALQLAVSIAAGLPFLGVLPVQKGRVLFLNAEDPDNISHTRFRAICKNYLSTNSIDEKKLYEAVKNITYVSMTSADVISILLDEKLQPNSTYIELAQFCRAWKPDLIILDPLIEFIADENKSTYAKQFYSALRRLNTTILILHHNSKNGINGEGEDRTKARGSSVFVENARTRMMLKNGQLIVEKNNYYRPFSIDLEFEGGMWYASKINTEKAIEEQPKPKRKPIRFIKT